jgi:hypothetical protein
MDVHPLFAQVASGDLDRVPGLADAVQGRDQAVEAVDELVAVGEEGAGDTGPAAPAQAADEELAVIPFEGAGGECCRR